MKNKIRFRSVDFKFRVEHLIFSLFCVLVTFPCVNALSSEDNVGSANSSEHCKENSTPEFVKVSYSTQVVSNGKLGPTLN